MLEYMFREYVETRQGGCLMYIYRLSSQLFLDIAKLKLSLSFF